MDKDDAFSETLGVALEFLNHSKKCFAGVHRIKENSLGSSHITHHGKLFRPGQCVSPANIAIDNVDVTIAGKLYFKLKIGKGGFEGSSVRKSNRQFNPSMAAAIAVARQWLDCAPPQVRTVSASCAMASVSTNSSLRILLPESALPVRSSLFINISTPSFALRRGSGCSGVGNRAKLIWGGWVTLNSFMVANL